MAKRLVKVASELNVGTATIVDHLVAKGFEIENRPTAKVSDDMYTELLNEFQNSMAVKNQADQLVIGPQSKPAAPETPTVVAPPPPAPEPTPEPEVKAPEPEEASVAETADDGVIKAELTEEQKPKVKVVGKIDLDAKKKPAKAKVEKEEKADKPAPSQEPAADTEAQPSESEEAKPVADPKKADELVRAKTPQLQGLKILGKIDTKQFEKKKKEPKETDADGKRKRKRTRRKVSTADVIREQRSRGARGGKGGGRSDEVREVSQKEIEDKIKATMARIKGGGKNKRQKIRRDNRAEKREKQELIDLEQSTDVIELTEFISVSELASLMGISATDVIMTCMNLGVIVSINQRLDAEVIELLAEEYDKEIKFVDAEETIEEEEVEDAPEDLEPRAPIVTVMGHVDHGKTSLLDYIRSANVATGEAGGITQHIGAYEVDVDGKKITFLDTPGHEAFTAMRARGAKVTDVVVIIIAADDNIMPQTKEAISHAQAAGVPMVFAINKVDKEGANPERIKQELASMNLQVEEWGGKYQSQDISAKTGLNIDLLLEKIVLEAELLELKANPNREAVGTTIEASLDKGRGYVTKILVTNGTMKIGDSLAAGEYSGKVKAMFNDRGKKIKEAGPATPVLVLGLNGAPQAGEKVRVYESEQEARDIATRRSVISREQSNRAAKRISLDEIGRRLALGSFKELNLIVKGDVDGSVEALSDSLIKLSQESVQVNVIHKAVGQIIESDVLLASASDAIVIGFQVRPSLGARRIAEKEGVEIKTYSIIYEAIDEITKAIEGLLEKVKEEKIVAQVEVQEVYKISRVGTVAGCIVREGTITRNTKVRVIRDGIVIYPTKPGVEAELASLKRFKDDAREVKNGLECGLSVKNFNDIKVGDFIEGYVIEEIAQTLN